MATITIYDEKGRTKLPKKVLEWSGVEKGGKVFAIKLAEENAVKLVPLEKVERVEEIVEERLLGLEEPLEDEVKAIKSYLEAKKRGDIQLVPLEDVGGKA